MDGNTVKWLCFTGTAEDYPAWSTKFTAFMQTKGLYKSLLGKEVIPQEIPPLAEDASEQQRAERETKVQQRNKEIEDIKERNNSVWCHLVLALDKTSLMYIRHDCLSKDGTGDGAKGWHLRQQKRRKAYRGQFSETAIAFTARRRRKTTRIFYTISRAYVKINRSRREHDRDSF